MILVGPFYLAPGIPVEVEMPRPNMIIDPRPSNGVLERNCKFECVYHSNGTAITLTRTDNLFHGMFQFRSYDPSNETVPDFKSTTYIYLGVDGERAPLDTIFLFIHPSVEIIKENAFIACRRIRKCFMHDKVHTIERLAFLNCSGMKSITLSKRLKQIGYGAFDACTSIETIYIPPSVETIEDRAFNGCVSLRILSLPPINESLQLGEELLRGCDNFFNSTQVQRYVFERRRVINNNDVNRSILDFYRDLPPLHKSCLDTNVTARKINDTIRRHGPEAASNVDHDGMTPLHILATNPHVDSGSIVACLNVNINVLFVNDSREMIPLDYLIEYGNLEVHTSVVTALCMHREMRMQKVFSFA